MNPFDPALLDSICEECGADIGQFCFSHCGSGYTIESAQRRAEIERERKGENKIERTPMETKGPFDGESLPSY